MKCAPVGRMGPAGCSQPDAAPLLQWRDRRAVGRDTAPRFPKEWQGVELDFEAWTRQMGGSRGRWVHAWGQVEVLWRECPPGMSVKLHSLGVGRCRDYDKDACYMTDVPLSRTRLTGRASPHSIGCCPQALVRLPLSRLMWPGWVCTAGSRGPEVWLQVPGRGTWGHRGPWHQRSHHVSKGPGVPPTPGCRTPSDSAPSLLFMHVAE